LIESFAEVVGYGSTAVAVLVVDDPLRDAAGLSAQVDGPGRASTGPSGRVPGMNDNPEACRSDLIGFGARSGVNAHR
jgi:hypothetical protein